MRDTGTHHHGPLAGLGAGGAAVLFAFGVLALAWHRVAGQVSTGITVLVYAAVAAACLLMGIALFYAVLWLRYRVLHPETLTRYRAETAQEVVAAPPIGGGAAEPRAIEPPRVYLNVTDDQFAALMRRHSGTEGR